MNQVYLKITQDANTGKILVMYNPDTFNTYNYNGNAQLLYLEAQSTNLRVRFATNPKIDLPTDTEFIVEPTSLDSYNVVVVLFECID